METTIALAGNPNSGKTTLFNELTGARQHVGNYPGVTVEKKEGAYISNRSKINIVDLPGTYSLTAYSLEEVVARDFLVNEKPSVVIDIVDASNLERNLYLTLQFMEMGVPVCIALNMVDVAQNRGIEIDAEKLSFLLGIPVIPTVARSGRGKKELMEAADKLVRQNTKPPPL
nr:50S ribosome-binding GTPase [Candidatus Desulfatibia profunda]